MSSLVAGPGFVEDKAASQQEPSPAGPRRRRKRGSWAPSAPLLLILGFLILVPAGFVVLAAFTSEIPRPGEIAFAPTLRNFGVLIEAGVVQATLNSLFIGISATALAVAIGSYLAFLVARTDIPLPGFVFFIGLMPLFFPSYVGALAWSILASPGAGLINVAGRDLGLGTLFNAYSFAGVILVMALFYAPYSFLLVHSSMSMMNPDLEDAGAVHGARMKTILRTVTFPLSTPAILGSGLLIFVLVFENFPVSQVLATPGQIDTLPTFIYRLMNALPSRGNEAAAVAILLVSFVLFLNWLQNRTIAKKSYTTVSGKGVKARKVTLGRLRWPAFALAFVYFLHAVVLPFAALVFTALRSSPYMSSFSRLTEPGAFDASAFRSVLTSADFWAVTSNSVIVAVIAAGGGTVLAFLVAYVVYRTNARGRSLLEQISMVPLAIPAIVLAIGLLWTWLAMPIPLYGTLGVLVIAFIAVQMPQGLRSVASSIQATDRDLEDAAVLLGAKRARAITFVTLPLMRVAISSAFLVLLMLSMRELTVPLFLYTADTKILSIAIFDEFENGGALQYATAMSVIYCVVMFILSYLPRRVGAKDS